MFTDLHAEGSSLADSGSSYRSVPLIEHTLSVKIVQKWVPDGGSHYQGDSFDCRGNRGKILCTYTNHLELVQGEKFHIFYYILSYI